MNSEPFGASVAGVRKTPQPILGLRRTWATRAQARRGFGWLFMLAVCFWLQPVVKAQEAPTHFNPATATPAEQIAELQLELTNAWQQVIQIVNQPVRTYARSADMEVSVYSPGWFHPGALTPDFNTVDVRKSRELTYASQAYVTSDLNPGVVFLGQDLEFNSMTKLFYVDRTLPKHKLSEDDMLEINQLYRIIGHCRSQLARLQPPPDGDATASSQSEGDAGQPAPTGLVARIQRIPREKRALYGGIAIGALLVLAVAGRLAKRRAD